MIKRISWQQASAILAIIVLAVGGANYTNLFSTLFQLKGIDYEQMVSDYTYSWVFEWVCC